MAEQHRQVGLATRVLVWNGILHGGHLLLAAWSGRAGQLAGVLGGFCVASVLLWGLARLGRRIGRAAECSAYAAYVLVALFNLVASFHWYFFGFPFTYSRLIDGAQFLSQEPAGSAAAWDGFLAADVALTLIVLAGPLVRSPRSVASAISGPRVRRLSAALIGATALFFVLGPGARGNNLVTFIMSAPGLGPQPGSSLERHIPLRSSLPEATFEPAPWRSLPGGRRQPNLLIFELESVGAPYISLFGPGEGAIPLPNLERLADTSLVAKRHYALNGGSSHNNDWAMLTSLYPPNFGETPFCDDPWILQINLFSYFKQADYRTGTFYAGNPNHRNHYKLYKQPAADIYVSRYSSEWQRFPKDSTDEERALHLMFQALDEKPGERFAFIYRTYNGHFPYRARRAQSGMSDLERYHLALLEMDEHLGAVLDGLEKRRLLEDTIVVVVGDHGEAFGQHEGLTTHGDGVYEELVRTPLVISYPRVFHETVVIDRLTTHLDVLPTLLALADLDPPDTEELEGYSLLGTLPTDRAVFLANGDDGLISGTLQGRYKLIQKPLKSEDLLFDLAADPLERENLIDRQPDIAERLRALERRWVVHRRGGIGQSRYSVPEDAYASSLLIGGNVDVDVFLNGRKVATLSDNKKAVLPLELRRGHNHMSVAGVVHHRHENTGLHVSVEQGRTSIGTGPWWKISSVPTFVRGRTWLHPSLREEDWQVPEIDVEEFTSYLAHRRESWIELSRGKPFVARLDFEVESQGLRSDTLRIRTCRPFELFVDGRSYGHGEEAEEVYEFSFPGRRDRRPEIVVRLEEEDEEEDSPCAGLLAEGWVGGEHVPSLAERWDCALPGSQGFRPAVRRPELRVTGDWSEGAEWFGSADPSERISCRYAWGRS